MRDLHVVALSGDGQHVVLATRPGVEVGEFRLAVDDRLLAAVRGELPRPGTSAPPSVTPKEIQARLRAGESVEQIAMSAGLPISRVERFAGPVLSEIERMVVGAREAVVTRARLGPSDLPLGEAVDQRLAEGAGYQPEQTLWSARREDGGRWVVQVSWLTRSRRREASWAYDPVKRQVTPTDSGSAALAHVVLSQSGARPAATPRRAPAPTPRVTAGAIGSSAPASGTARPDAVVARPARAKAPAKHGAEGAAAGRAAAEHGSAAMAPGAKAPVAASESKARGAAKAPAAAKAKAPAAGKAKAPADAKAKGKAPAAAKAKGKAPAAAKGKAPATAPAAAARHAAGVGGTAVAAPPTVSARPTRTTPAAGSTSATPPRATPPRATPTRSTPTRSTPPRATPPRTTPPRTTPSRTTPAPAASAATGRAPLRPPRRPDVQRRRTDEPDGGQQPAAAMAAPVPSGPPVLRVVRPDDDLRDVDLRDAGPGSTEQGAAAGSGSATAVTGAGSPEAGTAHRVAQTAQGDQAPARARRAAGQRASVPDWADVLLGTAPARLTERDQAPESS